MQGTSLLCSKLQEREQRIKDRVEYLAKKLNMPSDELWQQISNGIVKKLEDE